MAEEPSCRSPCHEEYIQTSFLVVLRGYVIMFIFSMRERRLSCEEDFHNLFFPFLFFEQLAEVISEGYSFLFAGFYKGIHELVVILTP